MLMKAMFDNFLRMFILIYEIDCILLTNTF